MDAQTLKAFEDELQKISASLDISARFELEKVASEADVLEKVAQLELAHQRGEINGVEKEAGLSLLRGLGGAMMGGAKALGRVGSRAMAGGRGAFSAAQPAVGTMKALGAGARGAQQAVRAGGGAMAPITRGIRRGFNVGKGQAAKMGPSAARRSMNTALGAGAAGLGAGAVGTAMLGGPQQPQQRRRY